MSLTLHKRRLQGKVTEKQDFSGLDMSSSEAYGSKWYGCRFTECDFSGSNLQSSEFFDCTFVRCNLRMALFRGSKVRHGRFEECDLRQSVFAGVTPLEQVVYHNCECQYAIFFDSTVREVTFQGSNLHGTDLRYIEATGMKYLDCNLWNAQVGLGCQFFNGTFDERSCDLFLAMVARVHPDPEKRKILTDLASFQTRVVERLMGETA